MAEDAAQLAPANLSTDVSRVTPTIDVMTIVRQLGLIVALAASIALGIWVFTWSQEPNYGVLFGKLDDQEASMVVEALQQLNIPYRIDLGTGSLLVPSKNVHDARIKLAAQGLPKAINGGFSGIGGGKESGFGISDAREKIMIQKALEQELTQTIVSLNNVKSARIHLAIPKQSMFIRNRQKPSASVVVSLYPGRDLTQGQVSAIVHLVSSSVPRLTVELVTVVDQNGRLLTSGENMKEMALTSSQFDYARKMENSYVERIENILTPILGVNAVRAQVTAEVDFTFSEQTQQSHNPDSQTPISVETQEEQSSGSSLGGVPGALSNQPAAAGEAPETAKGADPSAGRGNSRSRRKEIKNFELDKTVSHTRFATGRVKRISAAVVIDDLVTLDSSGKPARSQRSPEEIERITNLVKKAIGFNIRRGDSVNVINAAFTTPVEPVPLPSPPLWEQPWLWDIAKQVVGGLLILLILFGVLKPAIKNFSRAMTPIIKAPEIADQRAAGTTDVKDDHVTLTGEESNKKLGAPATPYDKNMALVQQTVEQDPKLVAQVVKNWVNEGG